MTDCSRATARIARFGLVATIAFFYGLFALWALNYRNVSTAYDGHFLSRNGISWIATGKGYIPGQLIAGSRVNPGHFSSGWSGPEPGGRWSDGTSATFSIVFDAVQTGQFCLVMDGYTAEATGVSQQPVITVLLDESELYRFPSIAGPVVAQIELNLKQVKSLRLRFAIENPLNLSSLGMSQDDRDLGLFLRYVLLGDKSCREPVSSGVEMY